MRGPMAGPQRLAKRAAREASQRPENKRPLTRAEKRREKWRIIRRAWPHAVELARPQARLWIFGLLLLLVGRIAGMVMPAAPKALIDYALPAKDYTLLATIVGVVLGATIIQGLSNFALTQTISKAGQRLLNRLRKDIHGHVLKLAVRYYEDKRVGDVVSRVMNDVDGIRDLVGTGMVEFIGGLISATLAITILFYLNWPLTLAISVFLGLFLFGMLKAFTTLGPLFRQRQEIMGDVNGRLTESIGGVRVVKAYTAEGQERDAFASGIDRLLATILKTITAFSWIALGTAVLLGSLGTIILGLGGWQLMEGRMTVGSFISYLLYLGFLVAPLSSIMMIGTRLSEAFAGIDRMREILGEEPEEPGDGRPDFPPIDGRVEFRNVTFGYDKDMPVLHEVNFAAEPGSVTALVGPSGSGKSTLISLIAQFHLPDSGEILVDGRQVRDYTLRSFREQLGVVFQDNFLFAGTVRDNLLYVRPDATEEELEHAARLSHCMEFIEGFPDGFDTLIGERGVKLSGGQRQRLAIARALLANPRLLILDEATSSLDSESEAAIQEGLATLMEGRTTFVIAHRLSTIRHANQILVLEHGRIVERGTHEELLRAEGRYHAMYTKQYGLDGILFREEGSGDSGDGEGNGGRKGRRGGMADFSRLLSGE